MRRYLLDTNHLSDALQPVSAMRDPLRSFHRRGDAVATCWPVLCEVEAGIVQLRSPTKYRSTLAHLMREVRVWPFDWDIVREYGRVTTDARSRGRALSFVDRVLAAMAIHYDATLVTADRDFSAFPNIPTENWL